jgi:sugar lactone lactonase YvrE
MMIILQRERPILQPAKLNLHGLSVIVLMSALLLAGCTGGAAPRLPVTAMPDEIVSKSSVVLVAVDQPQSKSVVQSAPAQPQSKSPVQSAPAQQVSVAPRVSMSTQQVATAGRILNLKMRSALGGQGRRVWRADGSATRASFDAPKGITTDGYFLYVADWNNHTIRKVDAVSGVVTTIAGMAGMKGSSDGTGTAARFNRPYGITTDGINLYVTDSNNHCIRKIDIESAAVTTLAGAAGEVGYSDGAANQARFFIPEGITTDGANLYVADTHNHSVRKIELASAAVTTFAGLSGSPGFADDAGIKARFKEPIGITTDGSHLFVTDSASHTVRKIR